MSQKQEVIRYLARGKTLTPLQGLRMFGTLRLSGRIKELRDEGWPISTEMVRVGRAYVAQYSIQKSKRLRVGAAA